MSRWLRLYADAMRNPKVMRLADKDFRLWVKLLCVASENEGAIPALDDLKLVLSMRLDHLSTGLDRLISGRLIDALDDGYAPHGWAKFQYKSDTSTDRVTKFRAKGNVSVTPPEAETEAEAERVSDANASSPQPMAGAVFEYPESFELFGKTFPNRVGKRSAFKAWQAARKRLGGGIQATARLQTAVEAYAASVTHAPPDHSSHRLNPATWLNGGRYDDPIEEISNVRSMGGNNGAGSAVVQRGNFGAAQRLGERHGTRAAAG